MKKILALIIACTFVVSFTESSEPKEINVWRKVSTDEMNPGEIVALDMSEGYSGCDGSHLFLVVNTVEFGEETVIVFPNGGTWSAVKIDTVSVEIQKHFGKLEEDLRNGK